MTWLLEVALTNLAMATLLAVIAWTIGRCCNRPALTHLLWVLVLLKLVTPPLFTVPIRAWVDVEMTPLPPIVEPPLADAPWWPKVDWPNLEIEPAPLPVAANVAVVQDPEAMPIAVPTVVRAPAARQEVPVTSWLVGFALAGSACWFLLVWLRVRRFARLLDCAQPAPAALRALLLELTERLAIRPPQLCVVPGELSPMLWVRGGRARLVIPMGLVERLSPEQWSTLLLHELAHWKRGDHWVRRLELMVLGLYWWCPLVWWARQQLQQAEEECCDAWVVWTLPNAARTYALALMETLDFLAGARPSLPPVASGIGHLHSLKRRLTMILTGKTPRSLTIWGLLTVAGVALALLPWMPIQAQDEGKKERDAERRQELERRLQEDRQRGQQDRKPDDVRRKDDDRRKDDERKDLDPAKRDEIQKIQEEVRKLQREAEEQARARMQEMHKLMEKMHALGGGGVPPGFRPGFPPGAGGLGGAVMGGGDLERRLTEVERKLDILLWEFGNVRREMGKQGPPPPPDRRPPPPGAREGAPPANPAAPPPDRKRP